MQIVNRSNFKIKKINDYYFLNELGRKSKSYLVLKNKIDIVQLFNGISLSIRLEIYFAYYDTIKNSDIKFYWNTASFFKRQVLYI